MTSREFEQRIEAMMGALYRVCYAYLSSEADREDAVQECLLKAYRKKSSLREERYFRTWVIRILINECKNIQRAMPKHASLDGFDRAVAPPDASRELHEAMMGLEEKLRLPVILHYIEGYPVADVAKMLRLPQGTVKTRMRLARRLLKDALEGEDK